MPLIELSVKDIKRGTLIDPGWYLVRIDSVGEAPSKDGGSTNFPVDGTIVKNAENGDEKYKDFPTPSWNFNSKAPGFVTGFLRALGVEPQAGRVELKAAEGQMIRVFIEHGEYNGRTVNRIEHKYAPASA